MYSLPCSKSIELWWRALSKGEVTEMQMVLMVVVMMVIDMMVLMMCCQLHICSELPLSQARLRILYILTY